MKKLSDIDLMPFGKYQGVKMIDIPASYLLYLFSNDLPEGNVKEYIKENLEVLNDEVIKEKKKK